MNLFGKHGGNDTHGQGSRASHSLLCTAARILHISTFYPRTLLGAAGSILLGERVAVSLSPTDATSVDYYTCMQQITTTG